VLDELEHALGAASSHKEKPARPKLP
jgi:hypothetical protein